MVTEKTRSIKRTGNLKTDTLIQMTPKLTIQNIITKIGLNLPDKKAIPSEANHQNEHNCFIWWRELQELELLCENYKGQIPDIEKELIRLINTDDPVVILLYARRSLEVMVTDLCEQELKRPRKTQPLKGIIELLSRVEEIPCYIITLMLNLNSLSTYGTHPKEFEVDMIKPVLSNLLTIIKWYLKYKRAEVSEKMNWPVIIKQNMNFKNSILPRKLLFYLFLIALPFSVYFYLNPLLIIHEKEAILNDKTVAILPFKDLSVNNDQSNFIEGMDLGIRYHLSQLKDIQLLHDHLIFNNVYFKKTGNDYSGKLNVDYLVLGEISKAGDRIKISSRIVHGSTGKVIWFQVYNEKIINSSQVLEIQDKIAIEIVSGLEAQINQEFAESNENIPYRNR
ncbi:MAG: hypothetical protein U0W24_02340 [Bacteroidales bacterium]